MPPESVAELSFRDNAAGAEVCERIWPVGRLTPQGLEYEKKHACAPGPSSVTGQKDAAGTSGWLCARHRGVQFQPTNCVSRLLGCPAFPPDPRRAAGPPGVRARQTN